MDRIKIRLDVDGNLGPIDQMAAKFKVADKNVEDLLGNIDKLNSKSITLQVKDQIASHRANDPLFKKIDFMPDKSIHPLPTVDILSNIRNQVDENRKSTQTATTDLISGVLGAVAGGGGLASITALLGGVVGGPTGAAIGLIVGKVVGALADILVGAMKKTSEQLLSFAKSVIDAAAYRQSSVLTLSKFTGSEASAKKEFDYITRIADKTSFSTKDIGDLTTRLFLQNFNAKQVDTLRGRALDIASLHGANPRVLDDYANAIGKIKGKGRFTGEVEQLDLIEKFLPGGANDLRIQIGKQLKLKGNDQSIKDQVEKLVKHRKVDANTAINAINELIANKTSATPGAYSKEYSQKSITGAISNIKDVLSNNLLRIDWDQSPGLIAFRKFLNNFSEVLGSKEFQNILETLTNTLFKGFEDIKKADIIKWMEKFENVILQVQGAVEDAWRIINKVISGESSLVVGLVEGFASAGVSIGKILVGAVLDALGGTGHMQEELIKFRKEQEEKAERAADNNKRQKEIEEAKKIVEEAEKKVDEKMNPVTKIYIGKIDARGKGKKVLDEVAAAAQKARLASGR